MTAHNEPEPEFRVGGIHQQADGSALVHASPHSVPAGRTDAGPPWCTCARLRDADGMEHPVTWLMGHAEVRLVTNSGKVFTGRPHLSIGDLSMPSQGAWNFSVTYDEETAEEVSVPFAEIATVTPVGSVSAQDVGDQVVAVCNDPVSMASGGLLYLTVPFGSEEDHEHLTITVERPQWNLNCTS